MNMTNFWWIPFVVQACAMLFDEFYFHLKRGLPKWERIGHPLDTLTVLSAFTFTLLVPFNPVSWKIYLGIALLSCLFVTKDEWVHRKHCQGTEQWLHALLFSNHPLVLFSTGALWKMQPSFFRPFILTQVLFTIVFGLYQIIYWNFVWEEKK